MPTSLDRALNSKSAFIAFTSIVGAVAVWSIWGEGDMFPKAPPPKTDTNKRSSKAVTPSSEATSEQATISEDPKNWTETEMLKWLEMRGLTSSGKETYEELLARVEAAMRAPI